MGAEKGIYIYIRALFSLQKSIFFTIRRDKKLSASSRNCCPPPHKRQPLHLFSYDIAKNDIFHGIVDKFVQPSTFKPIV